MKRVLQEILERLPGALGAAVVGMDGIPVELVSRSEEFNIDLASAEGVGVVRSAAATGGGAGDPPDEITVSRAARTTILRSLGPDYFLCVVIGPEAVAGQARFEAWRAGDSLREALR